MNPKVDAFLSQAEKWQDEMKRLRKIILGFQLVEELKWSKPAYTFQDSNILIVQPFKEYCALMFCKGALLKDAHRILVKPGENSQAARQIRFTSVQELAGMQTILKAYIREAIEAEKSGLKVRYKNISEFKVPEELRNKLDKVPALKAAFARLTPGRQRAYFLYLSAAKQSKTREARVEKCLPLILKGKGLNDE